MKFWKLGVLVTSVFGCILFTFLNSACERNVCDNVTCQNGGFCNSGICNCPTGYEGPQCQTLATARYTGIYVGYTQCDELSRTIDTAWVTLSTAGILNVDVKLRSDSGKVLHGIVQSTVSTYSILVTNNDTIINPVDTSVYHKTWTITLQDDKTLTVNSYEQLVSPKDSVFHKCYFLSNQKL